MDIGGGSMGQREGGGNFINGKKAAGQKYRMKKGKASGGSHQQKFRSFLSLNTPQRKPWRNKIPT